MSSNTQNLDPQQLLIQSAAFGDIQQMTVALEGGARLDEALPLIEDGPDATPFAGYHALSAAVFFGKPEVVKWLLEKGARIDAPYPYSKRGPFPPLAASYDAAPSGPGSLMHTAALAWRTSGINIPEVSRMTLELMQLLHAQGVPATLRNVDGATPLHLAAAERKRGEIAAFLLDVGCPLDVTDRAGWTALDRAVDPTFADVLLARGANANGNAPPCGPYDRFASNEPPLRHGNWSQLTNLIYRRAHGMASARLRHGARATQHALYFASEHAQLDLIEALLRAGADPNDPAPDPRDVNALAAAVRTGELRCVEVLLAAGAIVDESSLQPSDAEVGGRAVFALLAPRVDRAARSRVLVHLARRAPPGQLEALIECGVDLDMRIALSSGTEHLLYSALHAAAAAGQDRNVACLLKHGALDGPGPDGATALKLAQRSNATGARACVELLTAGIRPASTTPAATSLQVGRRAVHPKFGSGIIYHIDSGSSDTRKVKIRFEDGVERTMLARFLQPA